MKQKYSIELPPHPSHQVNDFVQWTFDLWSWLTWHAVNFIFNWLMLTLHISGPYNCGLVHKGKSELRAGMFTSHQSSSPAWQNSGLDLACRHELCAAGKTGGVECAHVYIAVWCVRLALASLGQKRQLEYRITGNVKSSFAFFWGEIPFRYPCCHRMTRLLST